LPRCAPAALLRGKIDGAALARLIAMTRGLPLIQLENKRLTICSPECGFDVVASVADVSARLKPALIMYAAHVQGHEQFRGGALPYGLTFNDTRRTVEHKIGEPAFVSGGNHSNIRAGYSAGIDIEFQGSGIRDPDNRIRVMTCGIDGDSTQPSTAPARISRSHLTFRLVAADPTLDDVDELSELDPSKAGQTVRVSREVLLDERDIAACQPMPALNASERNRIALTMTPAGAEKLQKITEAHIGERLAVVLGDRVLMSPRIASAVSRSMVIDLGNGSAEQFRQLAAEVSRAVSALPEEQPATQPRHR
jgi:hypothetical protein